MTGEHAWNWQLVCPARVMRALFAGAVAGGFLYALLYVVGTVEVSGPVYALEHGLPNATAIFVVAFLVWSAGLIAFGIGPWWLFHRIGFQDLFSAIVLGFAMSFVVALALTTHLGGLLTFAGGAHEALRDAGGMLETDYALTPHGWHVAIRGAAELGLIGAAVAGVIWRSAYRG